MRHFNLVHQGLDVRPMLTDLEARPDLWNQNRERKDREGTAHGQMDDIWLRYFPKEHLKDSADFNKEGRCVFYPAWSALPSIHPVAWSLMATLRATEMGGSLITRVPPGGRILPHTDGGWHANFFETKVYIPLKTNARCINRCVDEEVVFRVGEIWVFNNLVEHDLINDGAEERISVIMSFHCR